MGSLYKKTINGKPYYYLREMARVDGRPTMVSERYLGSAEDIAATMAGRDAAALPERTCHRGSVMGRRCGGCWTALRWSA